MSIYRFHIPEVINQQYLKIEQRYQVFGLSFNPFSASPTKWSHALKQEGVGPFCEFGT